MAGVTVAELTAKLIMDTSSFLAGAKQAEGATQSMEQSLKKMGDSASALGKSLSTRLTLPIVGALGLGVKALLDFDRQQALTEAHLKSTGAVSGVTAGHIEDMTGSLSRLSGVGKEQIASGQNMLLTFTQIRNEAGAGNDIFDQTTKAILDMSQAMGTDMQSAAIQVGKALQNPVEGVAALQRVGVRLTETQKNMVAQFMDVGDTVSAQKIILGELNTEFGGTAETIGKTFVGDVGRAQQAMKDAQRDAASALLPALTALTQGVAGLAHWFSSLSSGAKTVIASFALFVAALGPGLMILGSMARGAAVLAGWWTKLRSSSTEAVQGQEALASTEQQLLAVTEQLLAAVQGIAEALGAVTGPTTGAAEAFVVLADAEGAAAIAADGVGVGAEGAAAGLAVETEAAGVATVAIEATEAASIGLMGALAPLGLIVGAVAIGVSIFGHHSKDAKPPVVDLTAATKDFTAAIKAGGDASKTMQLQTLVTQFSALKPQLDASGLSIKDVADAFFAVTGQGGDFSSTMEKVYDGLHIAANQGKLTKKQADEVYGSLQGLARGYDDQKTAQEQVNASAAALGITMDGTGAAVETTTQAVRDSEAATNHAAKATMDYAQAQLTNEAASLALAQAQQDVIDKTKALAQVDLAMRDQTNQTAQALNAKQDATYAVTTAQRELDNANLEVARSEAAYADAIINANNKVISSMLDLGEAFRQVAWAQLQLERAPAAQARREADAADDVTRAYISQRKATNDVAAAQKALDELPLTHLRALSDAIDKVTLAYLNQNKAANDLTLAQQALAEVESPAHAQALADAVTSATIAQTRAHDNIATAQRKASEAGEALAGTQKEIRQVMAGNTEHLSDFGKAIRATYADALDATKRFKADTALGLADLTKNLEANIADFQAWQDNLQAIAAGGHKGLAQELAKMGPSAAMAVAQAANATGPELDHLQDLYAQKTTFEAPQFAVKAAKGMGDTGIDTEYLAGLKKQEKDQADAKKRAQEDVTLAAIDARAADENVNKALQDQANLYIDIQAKADAVTAAVIATKSAANGVTDALKAQADLETGPLSLLAQTQVLTDALSTAQMALTQANYGVTDSLQKQADIFAKVGPYQDLVTVAAANLFGAQQNLDNVTQALNGAMQEQSDLINKIGPNLDPMTAATNHLATATAGLASATQAKNAADVSYLKNLGDVETQAQKTTKATNDLAASVNQGISGILAAATQAEAVILARPAGQPGGAGLADPTKATDAQKKGALLVALNDTLGTMKVGDPLYQPLRDLIANETIAREFGGQVRKNRPYLVGEKHAEVFVPDMGGTIVPSMAEFMKRTAPYSPAPPSQPASVGGDIHNHVEMHVHGSVLTERDLVHTLHRGLLEKQRQGGNLGFEGA